MQFSIPHFLRRNKLAFLLAALASMFYFYVLHKLGSVDFIRDSLFSTEDSLEYRSYADWLSGSGEFSSPKRTFFYPLLILVSSGLFGYLGIWILQFFFWLAGCILVYSAALRFTKHTGIAVLAFVITASNISLVVYTAHVLTEIATFFLLTLFMYLLSFGYKDYKNPLIWSGLIFTISVLAAIRPVYQIIWYFWMVVSMVLIIKSLIRKPLFILLLLLATSPVLIQKAINKIEHGTYSSTSIADINLRYYFYRKVKFTVEAAPGQTFNALPDSVHTELKAQAKAVENTEVIGYLLNHPLAAMAVYWDNLSENLKAGNPYIDQKANRSLYKWTENINNNFIFYIHLLMTLLWMYYVAVHFRKKNKESHFIFISGLVLFYTLYTSGITYWAGDRLVIPAIAVWSVLYPVLIREYISNCRYWIKSR